MKDKQTQFIDVDDLRPGIYIFLDVGWIAHPFASNSFRLSSQDQIETIRELGIERIRYSPEQSVSAEEQARLTSDQSDEGSHSLPADIAPSIQIAEPDAGPGGQKPSAPEVAAAEHHERRLQISDQHSRLQRCESQFNHAAKSYKAIVGSVHAKPDDARGSCERLIQGMISQMGGQGEDAYIRLLSERAAEKTSLHSINVCIISLLLGKAMLCSAEELYDIGTGALLHDLGKIELPDRIRWNDGNLRPAELSLYREHVTKGATLVKRMGMSKGAELVVAQHHEYVDGTGYPANLWAEQISLSARIVSLVNHYDNLCNPGNPGLAVTPHRALSLIYAQSKDAFDSRVLGVFIRLMGVYPPGSVIELSDGRFAVVVSVNSSRPLRPRVIIHDVGVSAGEALVTDLDTQPDLGIRRSLSPLQLPKASYDYLSPRKRLCYYFERSREVSGLDRDEH